MQQALAVHVRKRNIARLVHAFSIGRFGAVRGRGAGGKSGWLRFYGQTLKVVLPAAVAAFVAACAGVSGPTVSFDPDTDFAGLETYGWRATGALQDLPPEAIAALQEGIQNELAAKGFRLTGEPDFLVSLGVSRLSYPDSGNAPRFTTRPSVAFADAPAERRQESVVSVVISMIDGRTNRSLWRGSYSRIVGGLDYTPAARGMVHSILATFPPE